MKDFQEFASEVLTPECIERMKRKSFEAIIGKKDDMDNMASFSATFALHMLAEYHEWLHKDE